MSNETEKKWKGKTAKMRGFVGRVFWVGLISSRWRIGIVDATGRKHFGDLLEAGLVEEESDV